MLEDEIYLDRCVHFLGISSHLSVTNFEAPIPPTSAFANLCNEKLLVVLRLLGLTRFLFSFCSTEKIITKEKLPSQRRLELKKTVQSETFNGRMIIIQIPRRRNNTAAEGEKESGTILMMAQCPKAQRSLSPRFKSV